MTEGRQYVIQAKSDSEKDRIQFMVENMQANKAYRYALERLNQGEFRGETAASLLQKFQDRFREYRRGWRAYIKEAVAAGVSATYYSSTGHPPQCIDIESAAVCDLACPFCFRQSIATPDKIMSEALYERIITQIGELQVPSMKLNWRGEPLLNPKLEHFVDRAKQNGVLEVIINTNAVTLDEKRSEALIDAGLDLMIFSFDGGTKQTYDKMRVGRFKQNRFEDVYANIRRFAEIRARKGSLFPRTKIQMILTKETFGEQESFFNHFRDCVDDVSVKAYTERGGELQELDEPTQQRLISFLSSRGLPTTTPYWRDMNGRLFVSEGRLACEQPFQRLMITFDGSVSMCCYDWGNEYPVGYVDERAYQNRDETYSQVLDKARSQAKGFELLQQIKRPRLLSNPPKQVQTLREIWDGETINNVRRAHAEDRFNDIKVCTRCNFKETYKWVEVP